MNALIFFKFWMQNRNHSVSLNNSNNNNNNTIFFNICLSQINYIVIKRRIRSKTQR